MGALLVALPLCPRLAWATQAAALGASGGKGIAAADPAVQTVAMQATPAATMDVAGAVFGGVLALLALLSLPLLVPQVRRRWASREPAAYEALLARREPRLLGALPRNDQSA